MNSTERKALQKFFNTFREGAFTRDKNGKPVSANCWQECVDIWLMTYETDPKKYFKIDDETGLYIMPDYSEL